MQKITKQEAITAGLHKYFTGKPCKYGHISERLVSNSSCVECKIYKSEDYVRKNKSGLVECVECGKIFKAIGRAIRCSDKCKTIAKRRTARLHSSSTKKSSTPEQLIAKYGETQ